MLVLLTFYSKAQVLQLGVGTFTVGNDTVEIFLPQKSSKIGVKINGSIIIPAVYDWIEYSSADENDKGGFVVENYGENYGAKESALFTYDGKMVRPLEKYVDFNRKRFRNKRGDVFYIVWIGVNRELVTAKKSGLMREDGVWLAGPVPGGGHPVKMDNGDYVYNYKDNLSSKRGIIDEYNVEIIPPRYDGVDYLGEDLFSFEINDLCGVVNKNRKVIIPTDRGYTWIGAIDPLQKRIPFSKPGYRGECNLSGQQVSIHKIASTTPTKSTAAAKSSVQNEEKNKSTSNGGGVVVHEHHGAIQVWVQCTICGGSGKCQSCFGTGHGSMSDGSCFSCGYSGKCSFCAGHGGHNEMRTY